MKDFKLIAHWWKKDGTIDWEHLLKDLGAILFLLLCIGLGIRAN